MISVAENWNRLQVLADWFNLKGDSKLERAQAKIRIALELFRKMNSQAPPKLQGKSSWQQNWSFAAPAEFHSLEQMLEPVHLGLRLVIPSAGANRGRVSARPGVLFPTELTSALRDLCAASETYLLDRLRECNRCKRWFVARRVDMDYCTRKCREQFWLEQKKTPEGREKLREQVARHRMRKKEEAQSQEKKQ